jgi:hypothetical protein
MVMADCTLVSTPMLLEEVLQRHRVDHRGEHAHVVGAGRGPCPWEARQAAEDVAAADDDGHLCAFTHHRGELGGEVVDDVRVDAEPAPAEDLPGELEQDPAVPRLVAGVRHVGLPSRR